jgi:serine/threonine-protein kinase HipA
MAEQTARVTLWNKTAGYVSWDENTSVASFEYDDAFIKDGIEISPLEMPLSKKVYRFPELSGSSTFAGLPGLLADSLPEKFGNSLMQSWLSKQGIQFSDLNPVERLCYLGTRGMGALEFEPDEGMKGTDSLNINVDELVSIARQIMKQRDDTTLAVENGKAYAQLIEVGTSAGGAKAKALVAIKEKNGVITEVRSGQGIPQKDFSYWLMKFSGVENSEHLGDANTGRLEYAYYLMAKAAGITMMESRLYKTEKDAHFMTKRFDRIGGTKIHMHTFAGIAHEDRDPVGNTSYEILFATARKLGLGQIGLDELYRRMVFNIITRNQDDHSKNHAFLMDAKGKWILSPAYDITFSFDKTSRYISLQQMRCNGKRDDFTKDDLIAAADAADVTDPEKIIKQVKDAVAFWHEFAAKAELPQDQASAIGRYFRTV